MLLLALLCPTACADPMRFDDGFVQLSPPDTLVELSASYAQLWTDVTKCAGASGDFARLRFYWHPTEDHPMMLDGQPIAADTKWKTHRIFLGRTSGNNPFIVRHEMLHDLLQTNEHPPLYFDGRCNDMVSHGYKNH